MVKLFRIAFVVVGVAASSVTAAPGVRLSFMDGRVWLATDAATAGQILAEWGRVGGTRIVNGDRIAGQPLTIEMDGVPEIEALDIVLRSASGFLASARTPERAAAPPTLSRFDRIMVLPASPRPDSAGQAGVASTSPAFPPEAPAPAFADSGARRIIGADGLPVPDDQEGAPAPFSETSPASTPAVVLNPGAASVLPPGAARPGEIVRNAQPRNGTQ